jgi:septal ring factor EnvC (AmiA/AmiB activator)
MWFVFPENVDTICIEHQAFKAEAIDVVGRKAFRAPAHFAPRILALQGFALAAELAPGSPDDLPAGVSGDQQAIKDFGALVEAQADELQNLRSDNIVLLSENAALIKERAELQTNLEDLLQKVEDLQERLEQYEDAAATVAATAKKKSA